MYNNMLYLQDLTEKVSGLESENRILQERVGGDSFVKLASSQMSPFWLPFTWAIISFFCRLRTISHWNKTMFPFYIINKLMEPFRRHKQFLKFHWSAKPQNKKRPSFKLWYRLEKYLSTLVISGLAKWDSHYHQATKRIYFSFLCVAALLLIFFRVWRCQINPFLISRRDYYDGNFYWN